MASTTTLALLDSSSITSAAHTHSVPSFQKEEAVRQAIQVIFEEHTGFFVSSPIPRLVVYVNQDLAGLGSLCTRTTQAANGLGLFSGLSALSGISTFSRGTDLFLRSWAIHDLERATIGGLTMLRGMAEFSLGWLLIPVRIISLLAPRIASKVATVASACGLACAGLSGVVSLAIALISGEQTIQTLRKRAQLLKAFEGKSPIEQLHVLKNQLKITSREDVQEMLYELGRKRAEMGELLSPTLMQWLTQEIEEGNLEMALTCNDPEAEKLWTEKLNECKKSMRNTVLLNGSVFFTACVALASTVLGVLTGPCVLVGQALGTAASLCWFLIDAYCLKQALNSDFKAQLAQRLALLAITWIALAIVVVASIYCGGTTELAIVVSIGVAITLINIYAYYKWHPKEKASEEELPRQMPCVANLMLHYTL